MTKFCESCSAPLSEFTGPSDKYCKYCTDEKGNLKARNEIQQQIAMWFKSWQGEISENQAMTRANSYMKSMPAWAEK